MRLTAALPFNRLSSRSADYSVSRNAPRPACSREVKRFEAVTRSPVYAAFSATLKGLPTMHAFAAAPRFRASFLTALEANGAWWVAFLGTSRCAPARHCCAVGSDRTRALRISEACLALARCLPTPHLLTDACISVKWCAAVQAVLEQAMRSATPPMFSCRLPVA